MKVSSNKPNLLVKENEQDVVKIVDTDLISGVCFSEENIFVLACKMLFL